MTITSVQEIEAYQATVCGRGKTSLCFHRKLCSRIDNCMRHVSGSRTYNPSGYSGTEMADSLIQRVAPFSTSYSCCASIAQIALERQVTVERQHCPHGLASQV